MSNLGGSSSYTIICDSKKATLEIHSGAMREDECVGGLVGDAPKERALSSSPLLPHALLVLETGSYARLATCS